MVHEWNHEDVDDLALWESERMRTNANNVSAGGVWGCRVGGAAERQSVQYRTACGERYQSGGHGGGARRRRAVREARGERGEVGMAVHMASNREASTPTWEEGKQLH